MQRLAYLDILKAFAIALVVIGHIISNCIDGGAETIINMMIYTIHIPLFLVISGYLVKDKPINLIFFRNLFIRFVIPYTTWVILLTLFYVGLGGIIKGSLSGILVSIGNNWLHSFLWFIKAYLITFVLFQLLQRLSAIGRFIIGTVILAVANLLLCILGEPIGYKALSQILSLSIYTYTLFAFGYCMKMYLCNYALWKIILGLTIYIILIPFYKIEYNYFTSSFAVLYNSGEWFVFLYRFLLGVSISTSLIFIFSKFLISSRKGIVLVQEIGSNTLQIYMFQSLIIEAILSRFVRFNSSFWGALEIIVFTILFLVITVFVIRITKNWKIASLFLWGK